MAKNLEQAASGRPDWTYEADSKTASSKRGATCASGRGPSATTVPFALTVQEVEQERPFVISCAVLVQTDIDADIAMERANRLDAAALQGKFDDRFPES